MGDEKTYRVFIDESGKFEENDRARLVGGVCVPESLYQQQKALNEELRELGKKYFPDLKTVTDIHLSDKQLVASGKQNELRKQMQSFFRTKMQGAKIAVVFDFSETTPDKDINGPQHYRHMLLQLLKTLVFYHPAFDKSSEFVINIAHRRVTYTKGFDLKLADQGYMKIKKINGNTSFTAITASSLVTMMRHFKDSLNFRCERTAHYEVKPYSEWDDPFMVMADFCCNALYHELPSNKDSKQRVSMLQRLFGEGAVICCMDSLKEPSFSALEAYYRGDMGRFLFETKGIKATDDLLLVHNSVQTMIENRAKVLSVEECRNLLNIADNYLTVPLYERIPEIMEWLSVIGKDLVHAPAGAETDRVRYLYNDVALRTYNHRGNVAKAVYHLNEGVIIFNSLGETDISTIREYHEFINRASISDSNEFAFERTIQRLAPVLEKESRLTELFGNGKNELYGKICGTMAQSYAFIADFEKANKYFELAAKHIGEHDNRQISYRAHLQIDMKDRQAYETEMCRLLKVEKFGGYREHILTCSESLDKSTVQFNLLLLLKGMLAFPGDQKKDKDLAILLCNNIRGIRNSYKEHPWQLVLINLGCLLNKYNMKDEAKQFWDTAVAFNSNKENITFIMFGHAASVRISLQLLNNGGQVQDVIDQLKPLFELFREVPMMKPPLLGIFNQDKQKDYDGVVRAGWFDASALKLLSLEKNSGVTRSDLLVALNEFLARFTFSYR